MPPKVNITSHPLTKFGTNLIFFLTLMNLHLPMYKYQSFGAKLKMIFSAQLVTKTHIANTLSGILSHMLKIYIPITVPVENNTNLLIFNT